MILVYRKDKDGFVWHFHTQCPNWPEINYVQIRFVRPMEDERFCEEWTRLESEAFQPKEKF